MRMLSVLIREAGIAISVSSIYNNRKSSKSLQKEVFYEIAFSSPTRIYK